MRYTIDSDITSAETLHTDFYTRPEEYEKTKSKIFGKSWQYLGDRQVFLRSPENVHPITLLDHCLNEPLIVVADNDDLLCKSNICTHRGFQIVHHPTKTRKITCGYHGRRFDLEGKMEFMPEFKEAKNFPRPCDHLTDFPVKNWKRFLFTSLDHQNDIASIFSKLDERLGFLDIENWRHAPEYDKTYAVKANWALYVDNYLEGFHIPFVHNDLNSIIDYGAYTTECYDHMSVQIGYGKSGDEGFDLPQGHPDFGKVVTAYYYWLWPNFMLNVYSWGVQINIVRPMDYDYCKVDFVYFIGDEDRWKHFGKDTMAEKVEREDEFVVESVQKGMKSRFYTKGRYSPKREKGVHHFHRLISKYMSNDELQ